MWCMCNLTVCALPALDKGESIAVYSKMPSPASPWVLNGCLFRCAPRSSLSDPSLATILALALGLCGSEKNRIGASYDVNVSMLPRCSKSRWA